MSRVANKKRIEMVKEKYENRLLRLSNVVGIGIGHKTIKVYVKKKLPLTKLAKQDIVPGRLNGVETDVEEVGRLKVE